MATIFRSDFRPQDEIFCPGMPFRPLDEQALTVFSFKHNRHFLLPDLYGGALYLMDHLMTIHLIHKAMI